MTTSSTHCIFDEEPSLDILMLNQCKPSDFNEDTIQPHETIKASLPMRQLPAKISAPAKALAPDADREDEARLILEELLHYQMTKLAKLDAILLDETQQRQQLESHLVQQTAVSNGLASVLCSIKTKRIAKARKAHLAKKSKARLVTA